MRSALAGEASSCSAWKRVHVGGGLATVEI